MRSKVMEIQRRLAVRMQEQAARLEVSSGALNRTENSGYIECHAALHDRVWKASNPKNLLFIWSAAFAEKTCDC